MTCQNRLSNGSFSKHYDWKWLEFKYRQSRHWIASADTHHMTVKGPTFWILVTHVQSNFTLINNFSCCEIWVHRYLTQCSINCSPKWRTKCDALLCCARYSPHCTHTGEVSLNLSHAVYASILCCCGTRGSIVSSTAWANSSAMRAMSSMTINILTQWLTTTPFT